MQGFGRRDIFCTFVAQGNRINTPQQMFTGTEENRRNGDI